MTRSLLLAVQHGMFTYATLFIGAKTNGNEMIW